MSGSKKPPELVEEESITLVNRVETTPSPKIAMLTTKGAAVDMSPDTGATGNMAREKEVRQLGMKIHPTSQSALQADGNSRLDIIGEIHEVFKIDGNKFHYDALVTRKLSEAFLVGCPGLYRNKAILDFNEKRFFM